MDWQMDDNKRQSNCRFESLKRSFNYEAWILLGAVVHQFIGYVLLDILHPRYCILRVAKFNEHIIDKSAHDARKLTEE